MQWADVIAKSLLEKGQKHLLSTGISPSGHIHVGSLREAITANAVSKALVDQGADVKLIYLVDDYDPLRKRYPFLPECYEKEIGRPLCQIPARGTSVTRATASTSSSRSSMPSPRWASTRRSTGPTSCTRRASSPSSPTW